MELPYYVPKEIVQHIKEFAYGDHPRLPCDRVVHEIKTKRMHAEFIPMAKYLLTPNVVYIHHVLPRPDYNVQPSRVGAYVDEWLYDYNDNYIDVVDDLLNVIEFWRMTLTDPDLDAHKDMAHMFTEGVGLEDDEYQWAREHGMLR